MNDDEEQLGGDLVPSTNRGLVRSSGLVRRGLDELTRRQTIGGHPQQQNLILTNEARLHRKYPQWSLVEQSIRELDAGYGNSFCCLASSREYIQVLRGFNGYHLEWRINNATDSKGYTHYRAFYPGGSSEIVELKKHDTYVNAGEHRDLLRIDDVIDAFRSFYHGNDRPASLELRILDI